ncbi:hypothetical protein [Aeromonas rivipollensis]|uniref:hypothetical protein n=1 Tax=Aeromonas rivipollensis TaxID=948519 RepID=UPI003D25B904
MQFIKTSLAGICLGVCILLLGGCEQAKQLTSQKLRPTYSGCLLTAVGGAHNLSAGDIRSLCAEAAEVVEARYNYQGNKMVPSNDFTRCYDKTEKEFEAQKITDATRLAKLSCKYPDVK